MPDELLNPDTDELKARLDDVARRHRNHIRWSIGKHTAEMTIAAIESRPRYRASGKRRRRKRSKRLL